jgi:hypothetical protein
MKPRGRRHDDRTCRFYVCVVVDTEAMHEALAPDDDRQLERVVMDEVLSNLESVEYVKSVTVRKSNTIGEEK